MNFLFAHKTPEGYENIFAPVADSFESYLKLFESVMITAYLIAFLIIAAAYVFQSIGLMSMLKRVGYSRPWHAWVPVLSQKAVGALGDMYGNGRPFQNLEKKLFRDILYVIALSLVSGLLNGIVTVLMNFGIQSSIVSFLSLLLSVADVTFAVMTIIYMVHSYMALWGIYKIFSPDNAMLFLLLSIFISLAQAIIIFIIRKKEPKNLRKEPIDLGKIFEESDE